MTMGIFTSPTAGRVLGTSVEHQASATKVNKTSESPGSLQNSSKGMFFLPTCFIKAEVKVSSLVARSVQKLGAAGRAQQGILGRDAVLP